jgi:hypothetical protein
MTMNDLETRGFSFIPELSPDGSTLEGYAAKFNELSRPVKSPHGDYFQEVILPGAFTEYLASDEDVHAMWEHTPWLLLGCRSAGTLSVWEDEIGLRFKCTLPETPFVDAMKVSMKRGDIKGMSFGFTTPPGGDQWEPMRSPLGHRVRSLSKVECKEITVTWRPVYKNTEVALRSFQQFEERTQKECERAALVRESLAKWKLSKVDGLNLLKR